MTGRLRFGYLENQNTVSESQFDRLSLPKINLYRLAPHGLPPFQGLEIPIRQAADSTASPASD
jgi:hypothetical protein